jgi:hypothetical protein
VAVVGRVGGATGGANQRFPGTGGGGRAILEVEFLVIVPAPGALGAWRQKWVDPASASGTEFLIDHSRATVVAYMSCHPGRYCATAMIYSAIREAEPWTPLSVTAGLLILAAIGYFLWREMKKP